VNDETDEPALSSQLPLSLMDDLRSWSRHHVDSRPFKDDLIIAIVDIHPQSRIKI
jgi:hypothetical protein